MKCENCGTKLKNYGFNGDEWYHFCPNCYAFYIYNRRKDSITKSTLYEVQRRLEQ